MKEKKKRVNFYIEEKLWEWAKNRARQGGMSSATLVRGLLRTSQELDSLVQVAQKGKDAYSQLRYELSCKVDKNVSG